MPIEPVQGKLGIELKDLFMKGDTIASGCGIFPQPLNNQKALLRTGLPPIILNDLGVFNLRELTTNEVSQFLHRLRERTDLIWGMTEFIEACGL